MATPAARKAGPATAAAPQLMTYRWSSSDEADRVAVEDPATGEVIAVVQGGGPDEVDAAVEAAHRAFETDWRWRTWAERATLLLRGADVLEEHADELALLESRENGKPVQDARHNEQLLPRRNRYSLRRHEALRLRPRTRRRDAAGVRATQRWCASRPDSGRSPAGGRSTTSSTRPQALEPRRHEPGIANPMPVC